MEKFAGVNNNESESVSGKMNTWGRGIIAVAAIAAGALTMAPAPASAEEQNNKNVIEQNVLEGSFQMQLIKNENILNSELEKVGLEGMRLGKTTMDFRCGITGVSFGVYTKEGKHIYNEICTHEVFYNKNFFSDFVKEKMIPKMERFQHKKIEKTSDQEKNPGDLLKMATFDEDATEFFKRNFLTLAVKFDAGKFVVCIDRVPGSGLPSIQQAVCYDESSKTVNFGYSMSKVRLTVVDLDGTKEELVLLPLFTKEADWKAGGFTVVGEKKKDDWLVAAFAPYPR